MRYGAALAIATDAQAPRKLIVDTEAVPNRRRAAVQPVGLSARELTPAAWLAPVVRRVNELLKLQENWDSYGAECIRPQAGLAMVDVLSAVMRPDSPLPSVVPSPHGHLQAEWHTNGIDLEVEVIAAANIVARFQSEEASWEDVFATNVTRLVSAVDALSRR